MLGAIAGDVVGSVYEWNPTKSPDFPLFHSLCSFTDDTVMTIATAHAILNDAPYLEAYRAFGRQYPNAGYGAKFNEWLRSDEPRPYNSWGNGAAMRVSPVGLAFNDVEAVLREARRSAEVTHNHPEGIKGAQAIALAGFMAKGGASKADIRAEMTGRFGYDLTRPIADIRPSYAFDVSCQGTVPAAVTAFLESTSVEHAVRLAISLGGDSDTLAAIAGGIAHAHYRVIPDDIATPVRERLPLEFLSVIDQFERVYPLNKNRSGPR